MDNVYLAVTGVALILVGVAGLAALSMIFLAALVRFALIPRLRPLLSRVTADAASWVAPPPRPDVAVARGPSRPRR